MRAADEGLDVTPIRVPCWALLLSGRRRRRWRNLSFDPGLPDAGGRVCPAAFHSLAARLSLAGIHHNGSEGGQVRECPQ
jgi:hypothetical protein